MNQKYHKLINLTVKNIFRKKLRSILTILSVIIGIASVVALITLSEGMIGAVTTQFNKMGANSIMVMSTSFGNPSTNAPGSNKTNLTIQDAENIEKLAEIDKAFAINAFIAKIQYKNEEEYLNIATVQAKYFDAFLEFIDIKLKSGKTFNNKEGNYAVIGSNVAKEIFKKEIKIGDTIKINEHNFKVIGIVDNFGAQQNGNAIYISRKSGNNISHFGDNVNNMVLKAKNGEEGEAIANKVEKLLNRTKKEDSFFVITAESFLNLIKRVLNILRSILISIAGISLIVASLGIINSVFTSVLERTKEIGVLKSIGAKISDITFIFVLESVILTLVGGFIGLFAGFGIAKLVEMYAISKGLTMLIIVLTPQIVIGVFLLSLLIGLISGFFPAKSAAKLNIVEALRQQ